MDTIPVSTSPDPGQPEVVIPFETEGGERWISISGVSFYGGTVYAFRDLTEVHHLEELKADFIATASHELRTPLAAVYGAAQTLLRHDFALDEGGRNRFISLIADESERLGRIVNEILLANQLDAGRLDLGTEPFDSVEVVERVVEATRAYAPARSRRSTRAGVPSSRATRTRCGRCCQPRRERDQVLARRRDGRGRRRGPGRGCPLLGARRGPGHPEGEEQKIFEKFYRLDPQMSRGGRDRPRALHLQRAREPHGRRIWVEANGKKVEARSAARTPARGRSRRVRPLPAGCRAPRTTA